MDDIKKSLIQENKVELSKLLQDHHFIKDLEVMGFFGVVSLSEPIIVSFHKQGKQKSLF